MASRRCATSFEILQLIPLRGWKKKKKKLAIKKFLLSNRFWKNFTWKLGNSHLPIACGTNYQKQRRCRKSSVDVEVAASDIFRKWVGASSFSESQRNYKNWNKKQKKKIEDRPQQLTSKNERKILPILNHVVFSSVRYHLIVMCAVNNWNTWSPHHCALTLTQRWSSRSIQHTILTNEKLTRDQNSWINNMYSSTFEPHSRKSDPQEW